jgi:hypothetical protein
VRALLTFYLCGITLSLGLWKTFIFASILKSDLSAVDVFLRLLCMKQVIRL